MTEEQYELTIHELKVKAAEAEALVHWHNDVMSDYDKTIALWARRVEQLEYSLQNARVELDILKKKTAEGYPIFWRRVDEYDWADFEVDWHDGQIHITLGDGFALFQKIDGEPNA